MDKEKMTEVKPEQSFAVIYLPNNAVELTLTAKVFMDGEIHELERTLEMDDIKAAFRRAEKGYIDDDDIFILNERGLHSLEKFKEVYNAGF